MASIQDLKFYWDPTIKEIVSWIEASPPSLSIGIVYGPTASGKSTLIPPLLHDTIRQTRSRNGKKEPLIVHICSQLEASYFNSRALDDADLRRLYRDSYDNFINVLRNNLEVLTSGNISRGSEREQWQESRILPRDVVFIVEEDPWRSVQFCILLTELLAWSLRARKEDLAAAGPFSIAILMMSSCQEGNVLRDYLRQALRLSDIDAQLSQFCPLRDIPPERTTLSRQPIEVAVNEINSVLTEPLKIAVICFPPWDRVDALKSPNGTRVDVDSFVVSLDPTNCDILFRSAMRMEHMGTTCQSTLKVICVSHTVRAPVHIEGFDRAFILLSPYIEHPIIDARTARLLRVRLHLSKDLEREQISWARRFTCPVVVYQEPPRGWPRVFVPRPRDVENQGMAGFLIALAVSPFADSPVQWLSMVMLASQINFRLNCLSQLSQVGILKGDTKESTALTLHPSFVGPVARAFVELLPRFNYDPYLALFVALPCQDPEAAVAKIQMAVLMKNLFDIFVDWNVYNHEPATLWSILAREFGGDTTPFTGTIWALLALWKRQAVEDGFRGTEDGFKNATTFTLAGSGLVSIRNDLSRQAMVSMDELGRLLSSIYGQRIEPCNFRKEHCAWTDTCVEEVRWHLLQCFVQNTVVGFADPGTTDSDFEGPSSSSIEWNFCDFPSHTTACGDPSMANLTLIAKQQRPGQRRGQFGLNLFSNWDPRDRGYIVLKEWTWIPYELVARWEEQH